jgi:cytochrome c5
MRLRILIATGIVQCCLLAPFARAQAAVQPAPQGAQAKPASKTAKASAKLAASNDPGEKKFQQNCSRCHYAPQELSPRISGTVVMHMRFFASLSDADEKAIVHYLTQ